MAEARTSSTNSGCVSAWFGHGWLSASVSLLLLTALSACSGFKPSQAPELKLREAHPFGTTRIAFRPDGEWLASGGWMGKVHIWSVPGGDRVAVMDAHYKPVRGLAWIDADHLLSASENGEMVVWKVPEGHKHISLQTERISSVTLLRSPLRIVVGYSNGRVRLFSYPAFELLEEIDTGSKILSVASSAESGYVALSMRDGRVRVLDERLRNIREMNNPEEKVRELRFSPDGYQLAGGGWFKIFVWDVRTGALEVRDIEHRGAIVSLDYDPDGSHLATIGRYTDGSLRVSAVDDGRLLRRLAPHSACGWNVRYSPDGHYLASSSEDGSIHFYNMTVPYQPTWHHN